MSAKIFKLLTEFRFEVADAAANTRMLTGQVDRLTQAADAAQGALSSIVSFLGYQTLGAFGVVGALKKSVDVSEKFRESQLSLATILSANTDVLVGGVETYEKRLQTSAQVMKEISKIAGEFSLDEYAMFDQTKMNIALLSRKGLAGDDFSNAIELSKNFLKSSPSLGIDAGLAQGQLIRAIEGQASMGDTLFRRLAGETKAMYGMDAKKYNSITDATKRFEILMNAMKEFASDSDALFDSTVTLGGQIRILRNQIIGINGILKPIGDAIKKPIIEALRATNSVVREYGSRITDRIGYIMDYFLSDVENVYLRVQQFRGAREDWDKTAALVGRFAIFEMVALVFQFLGKALSPLAVIGKALSFAFVPVLLGFTLIRDAMQGLIPFFDKLISTIIKVTVVVGTIVGLFAIFGKLGVLATILGFALSKILIPLAVIFGLFQLVTVAAAKVRLEIFKKIPEYMDKFTETIAKVVDSFGVLKDVMGGVFDSMSDALADVVGGDSVIRLSLWLMQALEGFISRFSTLIVAIVGGFHALAEGIALFFHRLTLVKDFWSAKWDSWFGEDKAGSRSEANRLEEMYKAQPAYGEAMSKVFNEFVASIRTGRDANGENETTKNVLNFNNSKFEINNKFEENAEPDRIALTIEQQLKKAALNPIQSMGRSTGVGFAR